MAVWCPGGTPPAVVPSNSFGILFFLTLNSRDLLHPDLNIFTDMLKVVRSHEFHRWSQRLLEEDNYTMELQMFGQKLVMADDPENIKAIQ